MKMKREVDALLGGLRDSDPLIRQKAAETLGLLADPETLPNLIEALSDSEPEVRQEIVRTIGSIGNPKAREALLPVVEKDPVFSVQLTAAFVLQSQGDKKVIPLLIDALEQGKPRFSVLLAYHPGLPADRAAHSRLQTLAHHEDAAVRREVAFVFGRLPKYKDGRERLGNMIQDLDEETRCNALYSLWDIRDKNLPSIANKLASHSSEATSRAGSIVRSWVQDKSKRN
jgi:HEAT repeat protein